MNEEIKVGCLVKFPSVCPPHIGYGIYLGEEKPGWSDHLSGGSKVKFLYVTNPRAALHDIDCEIWHRRFEELELCNKKDRAELAIHILLGNKMPKEKTP